MQVHVGTFFVLFEKACLHGYQDRKKRVVKVIGRVGRIGRRLEGPVRGVEVYIPSI
jgi:hypothetical protein